MPPLKLPTTFAPGKYNTVSPKQQVRKTKTPSKIVTRAPLALKK